MDDDYTYEEARDLQKFTVNLEPKAVMGLDTTTRGKMPFYRAVNAAIHLFVDVLKAKHGDTIDVRVPGKVGRLRVTVKRGS